MRIGRGSVGSKWPTACLVAAACSTSALNLPRARQIRTTRRFGVVPGVNPPVTSHLSLVPLLLGQTLAHGDIAVDATAGNGHDTLTLAKLVLQGEGGGQQGRVVSYDVQQKALEATKARLIGYFPPELVSDNVLLVERNHKSFTEVDSFLTGLPIDSVKAFVYNLGYLPGGDKSITTDVSDTIHSLREAKGRTALGGLICVTCYRGHEGGHTELQQVKAELASWEQSDWRVCNFEPLNWPMSPIVITAHRFEVPECHVSYCVCE